MHYQQKQENQRKARELILFDSLGVRKPLLPTAPPPRSFPFMPPQPEIIHIPVPKPTARRGEWLYHNLSIIPL